MTNPPPRTPPPQGAGGDSPERRALADAYDGALRATARPAAEDRGARNAARRRGTHPVAWVLVAVLVAAGGWVLATRPVWLFPNSAPTAESPAVREASLRMALAVAAERIEQHRTRTGALPASIEEVGFPADEIEYRPAAGGYVLTARTGADSLVLRSGDDREAFLGSSFQTIQQRGRP